MKGNKELATYGQRAFAWTQKRIINAIKHMESVQRNEIAFMFVEYFECFCSASNIRI